MAARNSAPRQRIVLEHHLPDAAQVDVDEAQRTRSGAQRFPRRQEFVHWVSPANLARIGSMPRMRATVVRERSRHPHPNPLPPEAGEGAAIPAALPNAGTAVSPPSRRLPPVAGTAMHPAGPGARSPSTERCASLSPLAGASAGFPRACSGPRERPSLASEGAPCKGGLGARRGFAEHARRRPSDRFLQETMRPAREGRRDLAQRRIGYRHRYGGGMAAPVISSRATAQNARTFSATCAVSRPSTL